MRLRIGTRGSALALAQTEIVTSLLRTAHPGVQVEQVIIQTEGDRRRRASLLAIGGRGVFTRELELALLDEEIDVAVHSLKDLPSVLPRGLILAATPLRSDPRDVLVCRPGSSFSTLPGGAFIGTGSLRRRAQLLAQRANLVMKDIRGNVGTRLGRLATGEYDAIVLASAGLRRLGLLEELEVEHLDPAVMLPAPAQGILGLECRASEDVASLLTAINDSATFAAAMAERALLRRFGIGCRLPVGALATTEGATLRLHARVSAPDGSKSYDVVRSASLSEADQLGDEVARELVARGAMTLLDSVEQELAEIADGVGK